jgi:uncharacterized membrane protein YhfC
MTNPFILLSGIGMMAVAAFAFLYWRKRAAIKFFAWGALIWTIAIAVKLLMDFTISIPIQQALLASYPLLTVLIVMGLYLGIRTGLFESGFTYVAVLKTKLRKMSFNEAVAFGIGFGGIEAFIIGFFSFIDMLVFILFPDMLTALPADQQAALLSQLNVSTWLIFAPIIERASVLFIHIFATVLVVHAVKAKKPLYFLASFLYKTLTDGMIPFLVFYIGTATIISTYTMELPVIMLGLIGYLGIVKMKKKFQHANKPAKKPVKKSRRRRR